MKEIASPNELLPKNGQSSFLLNADASRLVPALLFILSARLNKEFKLRG